MNQFFSRLSLALLLPVFAACVRVSDIPKDGATAAVVPDHYVEATSVPNQFRVHLSSSSCSEIRRQDLSKQEVNASSVDLSQTLDGFVDSHVIPGEKYRYQYMDKSGEVLKTVDVVIPQDLVIDHEIVLTSSPQWQNIYRVYFFRGGVLTTNGFHVLLKAQILLSEQGVIRTFPDGAAPAPGRNGRSGGDIKIFVNEAHGDLSVEMRGENGGSGKEVSQDGGNGGDSGNFLFDSVEQSQLKITPTIQVGLKGLGGPGAEAQIVCLPGCQNVRDGTRVSARPSGNVGLDGQRDAVCFSQQGRILNCE